ncbi:MAG: magnetosome protein MamD [Rhodospirillaceae bacterium]
MLSELVVAKLEGANQAALISGLTGKSFTVGQVAAAGNGLGTCLFLTPEGVGAAAGQGTVALKLEGTRQLAQMSGLIGKSVTVGKAPMMLGGMGHWVTFSPNAGILAKGLAAVGAAGIGGQTVTASQLVMLKLEGVAAAAQAPMLAGKTFTVIKSSAVVGEPAKMLFLQPCGTAAGASKDIVILKLQNAAAQLPMLVGKTFTVANGPIVAADTASNYIFLKPAAAMAGKCLTGTAVAAAGISPTMQTVALNTVGKAATTTTATTAVATTVAKSATAGTIWTGTGLSLGLGLGLGAAGPVLLGGLVAAAGYGTYRYLQNRAAAATDAEMDEDITDALK